MTFRAASSVLILAAFVGTGIAPALASSASADPRADSTVDLTVDSTPEARAALARGPRDQLEWELAEIEARYGERFSATPVGPPGGADRPTLYRLKGDGWRATTCVADGVQRLDGFLLEETLEELEVPVELGDRRGQVREILGLTAGDDELFVWHEADEAIQVELFYQEDRLAALRWRYDSGQPTSCVPRAADRRHP